MIRTVLDTSVLVAAARSKRGASHELLSFLPSDDFQPAISVPLYLQYREVLLRPENLLDRTAEQAERFLDALLSFSHLQEIFFLWRPTLVDPGDELVLELAVAADSQYIVTHNVRDFKGVERWGISAVAPAEFLRLIRDRA